MPARGRHRHKLLTDWARQMLLQVARWLPERQVIVVADMSYAAIELLGGAAAPDGDHPPAAGCAPVRSAPARQPGQKGRPRVSGARQPTLAQRLTNPATRVAAGHRHELVRRTGPAACDRVRHGALVPSWQERADPLGAGAGPRGGVRAAGSAVHGSGGGSG